MRPISSDAPVRWLQIVCKPLPVPWLAVGFEETATLIITPFQLITIHSHLHFLSCAAAVAEDCRLQLCNHQITDNCKVQNCTSRTQRARFCCCCSFQSFMRGIGDGGGGRREVFGKYDWTECAVCTYTYSVCVPQQKQ